MKLLLSINPRSSVQKDPTFSVYGSNGGAPCSLSTQLEAEVVHIVHSRPAGPHSKDLFPKIKKPNKINITP